MTYTSKAVLIRNYNHKIEKAAELAAAVAYCQENNVKSKVAMKSQQYSLINRHDIDRALRPKLPDHQNRRNLNSILTAEERCELAQFIAASGRVFDTQSRADLRLKIRAIIENRVKLQLKMFSWRRITLTNAESRLLSSQSAVAPSDEWFVAFYAEFRDIIKVCL